MNRVLVVSGIGAIDSVFLLTVKVCYSAGTALAVLLPVFVLLRRLVPGMRPGLGVLIGGALVTVRTGADSVRLSRWVCRAVRREWCTAGPSGRLVFGVM